MASRKLRQFQSEDVAFIQRHKHRVLIASAPGTGKTIECLACLNHNRRLLTPAIVIAPSSVAIHWQREAKRWSPWATSYIVRDQATPIPEPTPNIIIVPWALLAHRYMELLGHNPALLIADEAHYGKNEEALRSQAVGMLAARIPHVLLLTGTPLINRAHELEVLRTLLGSSRPPMLRRLLEDVAPDIPPKRRASIPVTLRPKDEQRYRTAESNFADWLRGELEARLGQGEAEAAAHRALAAEALVRVGYLRRLLGASKAYAAADWVTRAVRLGEPVVVFCEHKEVLRRLQHLLRRQRIGVVTVEGATPRGKRQEAIDRFQRGEVPVFLGTKAAKEGITLHRARHLLFAERFFTSAEEEQAEDRIRRIGQTRPTTMWFLHANGTIDDRVSNIIENKRRLVRTAIGSADIVESPERAVLHMISTWSEHVTDSKQAHEGLGQGKPLPPLPSPAKVCTLLFGAKRWTPSAAKSWARMNGYHAKHVSRSGSVIKVVNHNAALFKPGSFKGVSICRDVRAVIGSRRAKRSTRRSTRAYAVGGKQ